MNIRQTLLYLAALLLLSGCQADNARNLADKVLKNGKIYTLDAAKPWAEAVAITDGVYVYVGPNEGASAYIGGSTEVVDLAGKMVMPGINDAHLHPTSGGIGNLFACKFAFTATPDEIVAKVAQCVAGNPDVTWIRGGHWDSGFFDTYEIKSPRRLLDAVSGNVAVALQDDSNHNVWVNSKALELAGITKDTPDLEDGIYVRDPVTGEPNGVLLEGAAQKFNALIPNWTDQQHLQGALESVRVALQFGVTGMKDAWSKIKEQAAFKKLDERGLLKMHVAISLATPYGHRTELLDYEELDRLREKHRSANVHSNFVKIFMDGVPTASRTAAMLAPYTPADVGAEVSRGMLHLDADLLKRDLIELDRRGYTVKIHTAGDRAVRIALDAIEATRLANGNSGLRHELAHAGYIDEEDIPRFAELQAVADLSPYIYHPSPIMTSVLSAVGSPRGEHYWPIKDLLRAKAPLLAGSDWPAAVSSMNPWIGIEAMITRQDPRGDTPGALWPEQAISAQEALKIYTVDGARAMRLEKKTGSIELGKSADLIVLNHNLLEIDPKDISETQVQLTLFKGQTVYQKKN